MEHTTKSDKRQRHPAHPEARTLSGSPISWCDTCGHPIQWVEPYSYDERGERIGRDPYWRHTGR